MEAHKIRCTIVEVPADHRLSSNAAEPAVRELPLWADPFIAQLVGNYRLRAALDDSLSFLASEASHRLSRFDAPQVSPPQRAHRFDIPLEEGPATGSDQWPW